MGSVTNVLWMGLAFACLCACLVLEKHRNSRALASFRAVIHVNGIRGKTSTCRMLDAVLRGHFRVFTKTTGTDARILHVDGQDLPIRRLGPPNIGEQLRMIRLAQKEGAEIVILECMAVQPQLQRVSQQQIVRSETSVITNVRYDHVLEMGNTLEKIAASLAETVPENGVLYTADAAFFPYFQAVCAQKNSRCVLCDEDPPGEENRSIVRAIAASFGVDRAEVDSRLARVKPDAGMKVDFALKNSAGAPIRFLNLFAANDPISAWQRTATVLNEGKPIYFVYNSRWDRPDRVQLFAAHFFPRLPKAHVFLLGSGKPLAARLLRACKGVTVQPVRHWTDCLNVPEGTILIGLGNIKGEAHRFVDAMYEEDMPHE